MASPQDLQPASTSTERPTSTGKAMSRVGTTAAGVEGVKRYWSGLASIKLPSLFDDDFEDYSSSDSDSEEEETLLQTKALINDTITTVPSSYGELLNILMPRLQPHHEKGTKGVSLEEQQELSQILLGELAGQFTIIQHQIDDPFLCPSSNKELHRRVVVEICTIVEELYDLFLGRLFEIHHDDVSERDSSKTRLKAELMVKVNQSLNIPLIRRDIVQDLRGMTQVSRVQSVPRPPTPAPPPSNSLNELKKVKVHHPSLKVLPPGYVQQVNSLGQPTIVNNRGMPHYRNTTETDSRTDITSTGTPEGTQVGEVTDSLQEDSNVKMPLGISHSAPVIHTVIKDDVVNEKPVTVEDVKELNLGYQKSTGLSATAVKLDDYTDDMIRQDLMNMVERNRKAMKNLEDVTFDEEEDEQSLEISPLLAACGSGLSDKRKAALKQYLSKQQRPVQQPLPSVTPTTLQEPSIIINDGDGPSINDLTHLTMAADTSTSIGLSRLNLGESLPGSSAGGIYSHSTITNGSLSDGITEPFDASSIDPSLEHHQSVSDHQHSSVHNDITEECSGSQVPLSETESKLDTLCDDGGSEVSGKSGINLTITDDKSTTGIATPLLLDTLEDDRDWSESKDDRKESASSRTESNKCMPIPSEPQPETVSLKVPNMEIARASGHRVFERIPQNFLRLQPFPTFYNELNGELDDATVEQMDAVLQEGDDIQDIYKELSQTLQKDHLDITKDPFLERDLQEKINMSNLYASSSLQRRRMLRVINEDLTHHGDEPPWQGMSRQEWMKKKEEVKEVRVRETSNSMYGNSLNRKSKTVTKVADEPILSREDYQRFIAQQGTDFLGVIYHMYNSSGSDSEDEERERKKQEHLRQLHLQLKDKERKKLEILKMKTSYTPGHWNANTVLMGGLGKAPDNLELQEDNGIKLETVDIKEMQSKLESFWNRLEVPSQDRIDMMISYSDPSLTTCIPELLNIWEKSCNAVESRENALKELEDFERNASSPSRHFHYRSSSRVAEERVRSQLHYKLDAIEKQTIALAKKLKQYKSTLTYQGVDYLEKMSMDRTEMLYYLHQEQRRETLMPSIKYLSPASQPTSL